MSQSTRSLSVMPAVPWLPTGLVPGAALAGIPGLIFAPAVLPCAQPAASGNRMVEAAPSSAASPPVAF